MLTVAQLVKKFWALIHSVLIYIKAAYRCILSCASLIQSACYDEMQNIPIFNFINFQDDLIYHIHNVIMAFVGHTCSMLTEWEVLPMQFEQTSTYRHFLLKTLVHNYWVEWMEFTVLIWFVSCCPDSTSWTYCPLSAVTRCHVSVMYWCHISIVTHSMLNYKRSS